MRLLLAVWGVWAYLVCPAQRTSFVLQGRVIDQTDHSALNGAIISSHESEQSALTDSAGYFALPGLGEGRHHIHVQLTGYAALAVYVDIPRTNGLLLLELRPTALELQQVLIESSLSRSDYLHQTVDLVSIGGEELDKNRAITLAQSLSRIPGVQGLQIGVSMAKPVIRGLSGNRILVSDLGMKQEGQQWGSDHGLEIDQFGVGRMEIIKGPASLLYGSDAMGGVIHILPPAVPVEGLRGECQTIARSNNDFIGSSLMLEGNRKGYFFRVRGTVNGYGDYKVPANQFTYLRRTLPIEGGRLKNTAGEELHGAVTLGVAGANGSVKWTTGNYHQEAGLFPGIVGVPTGSLVADDGNTRNVDLPRFVINHFRSAINAVWNRPRGWLQFDGGIQRNTRSEQVIPVREGYAPLPVSAESYRLNLQSIQFNLRWHGERGGRFRWIPGVSFQQQNHRRQGYEFLLPDYRQWQAGMYLFGEWKAPNEHSVWNGGLRIDQGSFRNERYLSPLWGEGEVITRFDERVAGGSKRFTNLSGSLGWSWFGKEGKNLKVNLGKSFRIPSAAEWTINGVHHGTFRHEQGDASLRPENGYQIDVVGVYERKSLLIKFSPYLNYFEGYIYLRPSGAFSELPDGGQVYRYTQHDALFAGAELAAEVHPVKALHLDASVEYVHSYSVQTGLGLPFTPPLTGRFNLEYEHEGAGRVEWYVGFSQRMVARQWWTDRNEKPTNGYLLSDFLAGAKFRIGQQVITLNGVLTNAWNTRYLSHLSIYRQLNLPEQGRNVTLSLKVPFGLLKENKH